jgi:ABC-2 type transport system ATP-binding protein
MIDVEPITKQTMIDAQHITKQYGDLVALQDLSFHVGKGEVVGFLGPNGAGKTTTMRILTGFMPPTSGTARIAGYDVFFDSLNARRQIGYLPETVPLYTEMTIVNYLNYMAKLRMTSGKERKERVDAAMEAVHITERADTIIGRLSKGWRQRVGLAQALVHDPEVLILDEPTIGLDPKQIIEVRELIRDLGREHTIILSTHILPEVSQICTRVIIINEGRIVAEDTPERLVARLSGGERLYLEVNNPNDNLAKVIRNIEGVTAIESSKSGAYEIECTVGTDCRAEIARQVVLSNCGLLEMRPIGMSLEEVFLKLTTE